MNSQVEQLLQSLIDEDDADQSGERFLGEACDVTDERAGVRGDQQQTEEGRPQADAGPQGEVREAVLPERTRTHIQTQSERNAENNKDNLLAELEEDLLKDQNWSCAAQDGEGLTGKQGVGYPSHGGPKQGLNRALKGTETMITRSMINNKPSLCSFHQC